MFKERFEYLTFKSVIKNSFKNLINCRSFLSLLKLKLSIQNYLTVE